MVTRQVLKSRIGYVPCGYSFSPCLDNEGFLSERWSLHNVHVPTSELFPHEQLAISSSTLAPDHSYVIVSRRVVLNDSSYTFPRVDMMWKN